MVSGNRRSVKLMAVIKVRYDARACLQRFQLLEMARELVALRVVLAVGDVFLGIFDFAGQQRHVEIGARYRPVGKHRQTGRADFGKAADDDDRFAPAFAEDRHDARPQVVTSGA